MPSPHPAILQVNYMLENCAHCAHVGQSVANWRSYV